MSKETDLCQGVGMSVDMDVLLDRALDAYEESGNLTSSGAILIFDGRLAVSEYKKWFRRFNKTLDDLAEMSGKDIMEIGYG